MTINAHTANRPFSRAPGAQSCRLGSKGRAAECFLRLAFFHTLLWTLSGPCKHWGAFDVAAAGCGRLLMDIYQIRSRSYCATRMFFFFFESVALWDHRCTLLKMIYGWQTAHSPCTMVLFTPVLPVAHIWTGLSSLQAFAKQITPFTWI